MNWAEIAHAAAYHDHTHLIRDFRAFAGSSPSWARQEIAPHHLINFSGSYSAAGLRQLDHRFYTAMSIAIAITVFLGFAETFYLKSYFHKPSLHRVTVIHGMLNTCWILLFVIQNALVASGRIALHRRLGWAGAVLSLLLVPFGIATGIDSVRQGHMVNAPNASPRPQSLSVGRAVHADTRPTHTPHDGCRQNFGVAQLH